MELIIFVVISVIVIAIKLNNKLNIEPKDDSFNEIEDNEVEQSDNEWSSSPPPLFPSSYDSNEFTTIEGGSQLSENYSEDNGKEGILNVPTSEIGKIKFDLRKAVIYSAILEPKYKDL